MISLSAPDWNSTDCLILREFLGSSTGQKMIQQLTGNRPAFLSDEAYQHASFARSRSIAGYEKAIANLVELAHPPEPSLQPQPDVALRDYPPLDDDSRWPEQL